MIFSTTDPLGYTVSCTDERWNKHIASGHSIMCNNENAVEQTIYKPEVIYQSNQSPVRNVYFAKVSNSSFPYLYTKVVVEYDDANMTGDVVSAWPQKGIEGGIDQGGIKYVKPKL